jgi:predicted SAM-dependent methyltransferase
LQKERENLFPNPARTLLFAPEFGVTKWYKRNNIEYLSIDLLASTADVRADIQALPFGDDEFDFISCDHVLEHVDDYMLALKELYRVAKPGGCVEITVPLFPDWPATYEDKTVTTPEERKQKFGQTEHLRIFGRDITDIIKDVGFELTIVDGEKCNPRIVPLVGPAKYDYNKAFFCKKPFTGI